MTAILPVCHILSENRVTKSVSAPLGFSPNCKMCVRDTNTRESTIRICMLSIKCGFENNSINFA